MPIAGLDGLDVISDQFVITTWIVAGAVLALAATVVRRRRHRPHALWRWTSSTLAVLVMGLVVAAVSVNAYYAYLPTVGDAMQAATGDRQWVSDHQLGRLSTHQIAHASRDGLVVRLPIPAGDDDGFPATTSVVYLPPQYFTDPAQRFPVVYLFHGSPGQPADWFHAGEAARDGQQVARLGHPAIIVAPKMSRSWTDDPECVDGAQEKVESHLFDDVIPTVDARLRTEPDRDGRIFAGMSAGGYCALNLGLRHRDAVSTIIDMSGDTVPTHTGGAASLFGAHNPDAAADVRANSPALYAGGLSPDPPMRVWLDSGASDTDIVRQLSALQRTLAPQVQQLVWRVRPGGHTYWVWTAAMREALPWALGATITTESTHSRAGP